MAINWTYNAELCNTLMNCVEAFYDLYELACAGEVNGYALDPAPLAQVRADCIAAYQAMDDAVTAIKDWATS